MANDEVTEPTWQRSWALFSNYRACHGGDGEGDRPLPAGLPRQLVHDPVVQGEVDAGWIILIVVMMTMMKIFNNQPESNGKRDDNRLKDIQLPSEEQKDTNGHH